jgi:uncharacterized FlaG/YvyC family protein
MEISKIIKGEPPQTSTAKPKVEKIAAPQKDGDKSQSAQATQNVSSEQLIKAVQDLEVRFNLKVVMATDEATGREVVRIFSEDGKRLLRQMPPDQVLHMAAKARQGNLENLLDDMV